MPFKVIIDFDGTLTAEEDQVGELAERSLRSLAGEILQVPYSLLADEYDSTQRLILDDAHAHGWWVNGAMASYCDEGPFILHTSTLQFLLDESDEHRRAVAAAYPHAPTDPVAACTNDLFHRHTAQIAPVFRPAARETLLTLIAHPRFRPIILTNSLGDKVLRHLNSLALPVPVEVLGDTRQYAMDPQWMVSFDHPDFGFVQEWPVDDLHRVDLRRPAYYEALSYAMAESEDGRLFVVGDTFSLPGAVALILGFDFLLLRTRYTPEWCLRAVGEHPRGRVLDDLADLPAALNDLARAERGGVPSNR